MTLFDSYVICTSPRSGSTLLCGLLAATGIAGNPASYFYDPSVEEWRADLGVDLDSNATEREVLEAVLRVVVYKGRNGTSLFGLRQQAGGLAFLCEQLAVLYPQEATDAGRFRQAFGAMQFIHLTRPDKIEQAVSFVKAKQTGLWHVAPDGSELERNAPHSEPSYDSEQLRACVETMTAYDRDWNNWFLREGIEPVRIIYDDLAADPVGILRYIMSCLGLDRTAADGIAPGVKKLADETNENWVARFRADCHLN
jgi:trehalose 2-sulfotransferase